jgi:nicotinate-nucleotide adenylyltransferase
MGGTFDPIHLGHLAVAEQTRETLGLARILFIPAGEPPHKRDRPVTDASHRVAMVELAVAGNPDFRVSRLEIERPGPSYAVDTVAVLAAAADLEGREPPVFILSVEALAALPAWREPHRLLELCRIAVVPRRGTLVPDRSWLEERFARQADRFLFLDGPHLGHSATDIRARRAAGRSIRYLVPRAVEAYIEEHALYRTGAGDARTPAVSVPPGPAA